MNWKSKSVLVPVVSIVLAIILIGAFYYFFKINGVISAKEAGDLTVNFVNKSILDQGGTATATLNSVTEEKDVYKLDFKVGTYPYTVYISKDGKYLFPQGFELASTTKSAADNNGSSTANNSSAITCSTVAKTDKPVLEAFVVSNCPYGLQMQRILGEIIKNIPSFAADVKVEYLGAIQNGKITSMHGDNEAQENLRQICIRQEQPTKYWNYISCYIKAGDTSTCLTSAGISQTALNTCVTTPSKGLAYAQADFTEAAKYGAGGSPTLIINGKDYNTSQTPIEFAFGGRTAEAVKSIVCCGSTQEPGFCSQTLSTTSAATSFSATYAGTGATTNSASCGN